jgi:hypothetical protein
MATIGSGQNFFPAKTSFRFDPGLPMSRQALNFDRLIFSKVIQRSVSHSMFAPEFEVSYPGVKVMTQDVKCEQSRFIPRYGTSYLDPKLDNPLIGRL